MLRRLPSLLLALLAFAPALFAQSAGDRYDPWQPFVERPGVEEFSGRMLARPLPVEERIARGESPAEAQAGHEAAVARIADRTVQHLPLSDLWSFTLTPGLDENAERDLLMATGDYEYVHPDWIVFPLATPDDPDFGLQWHHAVMRSEAGWDWFTGDGTRIASFTDTGVDQNHEDLASQLLPGFNAVDDLEEVNGGQVNDLNGHGTNVAGCIGAVGDNSVGVAGVNWDILLIPVRVSNSSGGGAFLSDLTQGAEWAAQNGATTVSASYSGVENASVGTTGTTLRNLGALYFYAADNFAQNHSSFDWADTIVVGATDQNDNLASWSSYGTAIDCVAPGVDIYTTRNGGGYMFNSGTSFSTPLTNGAAALLWGANPFLSPDEVEELLYQGCVDLGSPGEDDTFGRGRVDVGNAVELALTGALDLTVPTLQAGAAYQLDLDGAVPGATVWWTWSRTGPGATQVPTLGTSLGLDAPLLAGSSTADGAGHAVWTGSVPVSAVGMQVWVQALTSNDRSQVVAATVQ